MSDTAFTYGNILLLYCVFDEEKKPASISSPSQSKGNNGNKNPNYDVVNIPDYITGRINLCIDTFNVIMSSKPDKHHTSVVIISKNDHTKEIKEKLIAGGVPEQYLEYDSSSKNIESAFNRVRNQITKLTNPPCIYFIGSVWQKDIFDSIVVSKFKGYRVLFEGALDNRPFEIVQKEKRLEAPKKGSEYYKSKLTNKSIDALLNYIFPKNKSNKSNNDSKP
ncbi:MAG TPA: hypothetical protein VEQ18_00755 [Candidatus Nitrosocosmicus sp.]|nr:hypothetical protein [Candidatus Nitrosocosmicus sp.]